MAIYSSGYHYLRDELDMLERGIRLMLEEYESRELEGQTPASMRGLVVTVADIGRSLQESEHPDAWDALSAYHTIRDAWEAAAAGAIEEASSEGISLPFASLRERLGLSPWERRCVALCLASELDSRFEGWFGYLNDDVTLRAPTAELALRLLGGAGEEWHTARKWLSGQTPLARFLLQPDKAGTAAERSSLKRPLRLDPRVVSFVLENEELDSRLANFCRIYSPTEETVPLFYDEEGQQKLCQSVLLEREKNGLPFVLLSGPSGAGKKLHARHLARRLEMPLLLVELSKLSSDGDKQAEQLAHVVREALLQGAALALEEGQQDLAALESWPQQQERLRAAAASYADTARLPLVLWLTRQERRQTQLPLPSHAAVVPIALGIPSADIRFKMWQRSGSAPSELLRHIADKYAFTAGQMEGMGRQAQRLAEREGRDAPALEDYAAASRTQVQHRLSELAENRRLVRGWDDLVLPEEPLELLRDACNRYKYNETVLNRWGFGRKLPYGRGISMLFAGPPGTGKTMAAEVAARELGLELYRIDLSRVVSKYIGETEKNLRELFAEAENSGSILFFDEGDSLFGKRTEVKDSNDRFANMEAAYLLQRIESFDGVSILATNLLQNMDEAFLRRMQVIVKFPFPDAAQREQIFRSLLPPDAPLDDDLDLAFLAARVDASGGHIKNIVLSAAYMAAAEQAPIGMRQLIKATRQELHKMGKIIVKEAFAPYV